MHRQLLTILFLFSIFSCTPIKIQTEISTNTWISECPNNGTCNFEIQKNKSVTLIRDEFGNFYPKFLISHHSNVLVISYSKNVPEGIMDGHYIETFYLEVPKNKSEWILKDKALYRSSLIYGRECRCPGETGFEYVLEGDLKYSRMRSIVEIDLNVKNTTLPLIFKKFSLKADIFDNF